MGNGDRDWKFFFSDEVTFSTTKGKPTFVYRPHCNRFDHRNSAIRARSGRESVSRWGGFIVVEWAQSIVFAENSCRNALWFYMIGSDGIQFQRIITQFTYLN